MSNNADGVVLVIAGPTASGKSALALEEAEKRDGVIINADSVQLYADLPILTAQPDAANKARAPHCLYGMLGPEEISSAGIWRAQAVAEIEAALNAGKLPIVTGGTGLYIQALMQGLSPVPPVSGAAREEAGADLARLGHEGLHEELAKADPELAAKVDPRHTSRLLRAWEVWLATGTKLSDWQAMPREGPPGGWTFHVRVILPEREALSERCARRFAAMLEAGAMDEVRALSEKIDAGLVAENAPATRALGFAELRAALQGKMPQDEAGTRTVTLTRQYARRQMTWLRHQLKADEVVTPDLPPVT